MSFVTRRLAAFSTAMILLAASQGSAFAQKKYDTGATDTEIKIGNIMPYSGPVSAYALIGRTQDAFFKKLNAEGGINGRKINFISYDDAYSPPKTVEQARKLVESDGVLLIFESLGTPTNNAIRQYMNQKKVPQLFVATGATQFKGILSTNYLKDPTDPTWKDDPALKEWASFMDKYFPEGDKTSTFSVYGYLTAQTMVQVLKQCGDELTRENVMRQAANLKDLELGLLLPGIKINTSPTDYFPVEQMQMSRFNGEHGELFGPVIAGEIGTQ
jgi:ABC-type branched-subunit amino acid transport system substrate-binding protein